MYITGLGTAVPPRRYTQAECWERARALEQFQRLSPRARAIVKKVLLGNNGIEARHLSLESIAEVFAIDPDTLHTRFAKNAPLLAAQAAQRALAQSKASASQIDAVIVSTCTGYLCPGLTSYLAESLGLPLNVCALDLVGQGCGAALPNLRTGEALLASARAQRVLSVSVEVCSAAFYLDDDPGVLISACLFADAAGAAVLSHEPQSDTRRIEWLAVDSILDPSARDLLRFETTNGMLRNILTPPVPALAAKYAARLFHQMAGQCGIKHKDISAWIFHAGGRDVLSALQHELAFKDSDLSWSAAVLRQLGNVSSPFVFHVLERALQGGAPGGLWWMSSFGAGFSCHGALLKVD
ncbi:MAG: stilbene synthase [Verrucomicrobia subdivision 3 bacterium]|nr:stilbene synthase [Limisphaerales bacterium]